MTNEEKRLKVLESIEAVALMDNPLMLFLKATETEIFISDQYRPVAEFFDIEYRIVETNGIKEMAIPRNEKTYKPIDPNDPRKGGYLFISNRHPVFLSDI